MKIIKFRGTTPNGKIVFGDLISPTTRDFYPTIKAGHADYHEVKPDSIAQLVGFDSNGKEVYEGDKVVDKFGEEYTAQWTKTLREEYKGGFFGQATERFWADRARYTPLTLKEDSHEVQTTTAPN